MWVNNLLRLLRVEKVSQPGFEPVTYRSRSRHANHSAAAPHMYRTGHDGHVPHPLAYVYHSNVDMEPDGGLYNWVYIGLSEAVRRLSLRTASLRPIYLQSCSVVKYTHPAVQPLSYLDGSVSKVCAGRNFKARPGRFGNEPVGRPCRPDGLCLLISFHARLSLSNLWIFRNKLIDWLTALRHISTNRLLVPYEVVKY